MLHQNGTQTVRTAATLVADAGGTAVPTSAVGCHGAKAVIFSLTASDATLFAAGGVIQVSDDLTLWQAAASPLGVNVLGGITAAMNAGGTKLILVPSVGSAASTVSGIPWLYARMNLVPNATTNIPALQVLADLIY